MFKDNQASELNVVLKADTQGSVEAISDALCKLATDEVKVNIIGSGVGGITETDATLATASSAIIVGFNVRADAPARRVIETEGVDLHYYSVIYDLIDDVKKAMSGLLRLKFSSALSVWLKYVMSSSILSTAQLQAVWLPKVPLSVLPQSECCVITLLFTKASLTPYVASRMTYPRLRTATSAVSALRTTRTFVLAIKSKSSKTLRLSAPYNKDVLIAKAA